MEYLANTDRWLSPPVSETAVARQYFLVEITNRMLFQDC